MKVFLFVVFTFLTFGSFGQTKQVCFTLDDLPVVNYGVADSTYQIDLFNKFIASLTKHKVPAIGFVNERKLYRNGKLVPYQVNLLKRWVRSGLDLGNHTFSHIDYNKVSLDAYAQDITKGETVTKRILKDQGGSLRYFRHPFLHVGNSKAKADSLTELLDGKGYVVAPVTVDNEDYLFALAYKRAKDKGDSSLYNRIGRDYLEYMEEKIKYYEVQAEKLFGRNIKQVLLIHTSLLNSDYIDSLVSLYKKHGYAFVSLEEALKDPVHSTDISVYGNWGISWIDKWALSQGKKGDFFKDEPETPEYVRKLAD